jgi:glycerol kinase
MTASEYILALDQGTTTSRALLFDVVGNVRAVGQRPLSSIYPRPGWVEHDAEDIWTSLAGAIEDVLKAVPEARTSTLVVGIANQRETVVAWDKKTGQPVAPAISWQCRRTADMCRALSEQGLDDIIRSRTGLRIDPYFSATKIAWLLREMPELAELARERRLAMGTVDSWIIYRLTGGAHLTDVSNASRTLLLNLGTLQWDDELLDLFHIPKEILPSIVDSAGVAALGSVNGFSNPIPIGGIAGDQQASLFGHGCTQPGMTKNTYGTGTFLLMNTGTQPVLSHSSLLTTVAWRINGTTAYALEGSLFAAGSVVEWLKDNLHVIQNAAESETLAMSVVDTGDVYFVPAFVGLGAPYWDSYARGTIVGITRGTTAAHLVRAALEAIAYQSRDIVDVMIQESGHSVPSLHADGGVIQNRFLAQFQADILGVPVIVSSMTEMTAVGAAALAARAIGLETISAMTGSRGDGEMFHPHMQAERRIYLYGRWKEAVSRALGWGKADSLDALEH